MTSLRDALLAAPGTPAGAVTVSGVTVHLKRWTLREIMLVQQLSADKDRGGATRIAELVSLSACDEAGALLFPPGDEGVYGLSLADGEAIIDAALAANGMGKGDAARGKANSPPTTSFGS